MNNKFNRAVLAVAMVATLLAVFITNSFGADILRDGAPHVLVSGMKMNVATASNLNAVISMPTQKELFLQASYGISNVVPNNVSSNLTFLLQYSLDGVNWSGNAGSGASGGAVPNNCTAWSVSAMIASGTNHVACTNLSLGGVPYVRVAYVTNGISSADCVVTNLTLKAWVK